MRTKPGFQLRRIWISPDEYATWKIDAGGTMMTEAAPEGLTITLIEGLIVDATAETQEDFKAGNRDITAEINARNRINN